MTLTKTNPSITRGIGVLLKFIESVILIMIAMHSAIAQTGKMANDTVRLNAYCNKAIDYSESNRDRSIIYGMRALEIARKLNQKFYEASILSDLGYAQLSNGDYSNAMNSLVLASKLVEDKDIGKQILPTQFIKMFTKENQPEENRMMLVVYIKNNLALLYGKTRNPQKQLEVLQELRQIVETGTKDQRQLFTLYINIVSAYLEINKLDSALIYQKKVLEIDKKIDSQVYQGVSQTGLAEIYLKMGRVDSARKYFHEGLRIILKKGENVTFKASTLFGLSRVYKALGNADSSLLYANATIKEYQSLGASVPELADSYDALSSSFSDNHKFDSAFIYMQLARNLSDSLYEKEIKDLARFQNIGFEELLRLKEAENDMKALQNRREMMALLAGLLVVSAATFLLYRNNRQRRKANKELEETLSHLKATQSQLIQSEKMASLGELTAGIAHEIQNPLNFVNNFAEVSSELLDEMNAGLEKGEIQDVKAIAEDIKVNLEKINHHGKRADAIVKGMLQHSRTSSGKNEPTDINTLTDEYFRLAYHGLRAKDKAFNVKIETDFDKTIGKINLIPQDMGRVILNLLTNAFYAVDEKKKSGPERYEPLVSVSTKNLIDRIEIRVKDNGNGIPQKVLDKIFQPFFTTKPTGQGTGLGLSLSYDIVKAHGGELIVETKEGEGSTFIIQLPT